MNEQEFLDAIDGRFPFTNTQRARDIIRVGCSISAEAAFAVVYELAVPGASARAPRAIRHDLLNLVDEELDHPAKELVLPIVRKRINGEMTPGNDIIVAMKEVEKRGCVWSALNILSYSCVEEDEDAVSETYEQIVARRNIAT